MKLGSATVFFLHLVINAMALVHKQSFPLRKPLSSKLRASQAVHSFHREFALYASKEPSFSSLRPVPKNAHRFVFMRHGESAFNQANIFTVRYISFVECHNDILSLDSCVCLFSLAFNFPVVFIN